MKRALAGVAVLFGSLAFAQDNTSESHLDVVGLLKGKAVECPGIIKEMYGSSTHCAVTERGVLAANALLSLLRTVEFSVLTPERARIWGVGLKDLKGANSLVLWRIMDAGAGMNCASPPLHSDYAMPLCRHSNRLPALPAQPPERP